MSIGKVSPSANLLQTLTPAKDFSDDLLGKLFSPVNKKAFCDRLSEDSLDRVKCLGLTKGLDDGDSLHNFGLENDNNQTEPVLLGGVNVIDWHSTKMPSPFRAVSKKDE